MLDSSVIAAIATAPGEAGIGMIRLSGNDAPVIAARVFRRGKRGGAPVLRAAESHRILYGRIVDPSTEAVIDEAMLAWMAAPRTYTRENTVEITCHGGMIPLRETLRVILASGARHAEPGEFTLRAFLHGRIDLAQAEAVLDVVSSRTVEGLRLATGELAGNLTRRLQPARAALVTALAYLDAAADFPEDEIPAADIDADLAAAAAELDAVLQGSRAGMLYRDGVQIALVGRPNVGKSSLLNALLRSDRAIVTPIAGTTRDVIAETIDLRGIPATLLDTAGIAESSDPVEQIGIERSRRALSSAATTVLVLDGSVPPSDDDLNVARILTAAATAVVVAINKADLLPMCSQQAVLDLLPACPVVTLSAERGDGLAELEGALFGAITRDGVADSQPALINARQQSALARAHAHVREAVSARNLGMPVDLLATDVRAALHAVGQVTGEDVDEAVLTEIFSRFCIGK